MTRNLKVLGLALVAIFAMAALSAASASAEDFHFETEHTILTAHPVPGGNAEQVFNAGENGKVVCTEIALHNTTVLATKVGTNNYTATEITANPTYSECHVIRGSEVVPADVEFTNAAGKSCDYLFTSETTASHEHYVVHIKCEPEAEIKIKLTIAGLKIKCLAVPAQTPTGGGVVFDNTNPGTPEERDIDLTATVTGIEYTVENSACGTVGTFNNATYNGEVTVTGETEGGVMMGIWFE